MISSIYLLMMLAELGTEKGGGNSKLPVEMIFMLGIVVLSFVMLRATHKRIKRNSQRKNIPLQERLGMNVGQERQTISQMNELMASLADLSRQINAQIDTRLAKLESLLADADRKIQLLDRLNGDSSGESDSAPPVAPSNPSEVIQDISRQFHAPAPTEVLPPAGAPAPAEKPLQPVELSPEAHRVLELMEQGLSKIAIAQRLCRPIGEIELIMSLAGKKSTDNEAAE